MEPPPVQRVAVVCASNMNRSMEAHRVFAAAGANVRCPLRAAQRTRMGLRAASDAPLRPRRCVPSALDST